MDCIILAGGLGTRMLAVSSAVPKALMPVCGRPFADHQLALLASQGIDRVTFCIGHLGRQVRAFVGDGSRWSLRVDYVEEGDALRGTAGALRLAFDQGALPEKFFVLYGDSYLPIAYRPVWEEAADTCLMTVLHNRGRWDASNVVFRDGRVVLYEKGRADAAAIGMEWIDYGLLVLRREVVAAVPADRKVDLAEPLQQLCRAGELRGHEVQQRFYEIGSPSGLGEMERFLSAGQA